MEQLKKLAVLHRWQCDLGRTKRRGREGAGEGRMLTD
jgi:hypothetical protein